MQPDAALAVCRFLHDASAMFVWGASAYLAALVPRTLAQMIGRRLRSMTVVAIAVAVATTLVALPIQAATIGEGWSDALYPETLGNILFGTSVGVAWLFQSAAALILLATLMVSGRGGTTATAAAGALVLLSVSLTGHAVMQEGWIGLAHRLNDAAHILSAGAWLGALLPLISILQLKGGEHCHEAQLALSRFSVAGQTIVGLVVVSGIANTALVLGRWPTDWSSAYQALLAVKIAVVAVMTGLALINRYVLVPRLGRYPSGILRGIRAVVVAEIALGLTAVGLVSVFGMLDPM